ncbi:MAG TPA: hypothetical protein VM164_08195 [Burkholderiales bacterium]|nr:hypothetical protein [Burkholderiales bacterium]
MAFAFKSDSERPLAAVSRATRWVLLVALGVQLAWQALSPNPTANATQLGMPADTNWFHAASLGEPIPLAHLSVLYLQAFDNQPGISIPYRELDYGSVQAWLKRALELDPEGQYPLMMAAQLYAQVPDEAKQRQMLAFVHREFMRDPDRRWRWLAHAAIVAKHRLKDMPLALRYAEDITRYASSALHWARQMRIFILEDMGEAQAAAVLLGGLLASGEVMDAAEIRFLTERLERLKSVEKSSKASEFR